MTDKRGKERRTRRSEHRRSKQGKLFEALQPLEERLLLTLTYTTYPIPMVALVQPQAIASGPDGNLWFTESGSGQIGRVTPAGVVTQFTLPTVPPPPGSSPGTPASLQTPQAIAAGPDGALWFTTDDSLVGRIGTDGTITEFAVDGLTDSESEEMTVGPDGALWFTGVTGAVGRITTAGVVTEFAVPGVPPPTSSPPGSPDTPVSLYGITSGPDGAIWFTAANGTVGRITTAGLVTEFAAPSYGLLSGITTGPDGALWFTCATGQVGRITTAGVVTEYAAPDVWDGATTIITGPDGNLWFTMGSDASGGATIGRITPAGVFTSFAVPGVYSLVAGLTAGPDGNLWFTEQEDNSTAGEQPAVGKISPAGVTTLFPIARGTTLDPDLGVDSSPTAIMTGPDGALWFAETGAIGRITTAGTIEQFALAPGATPVSITTGPDDTLWFTQQDAGTNDNGGSWSIGRITTAGAITLFPLAAGIVVSDVPSNGSVPAISGITEGRDGNVWFTENLVAANTLHSAAAIARITPDGTIATFAIPIPKDNEGLSTGAIAVGPDGNIWFTGDFTARNNQEHSVLGRVTARGQVRLFRLPSSSYSHTPYTYAVDIGYEGNDANSLVAGPDGKLWYAGTVDKTKPGIATISTRGESGRFTPIDSLGDLTAGPNGQVWFPISSSELGLATRSGTVVTEDLAGHVATSSYSPYPGIRGVAAGPDGNLWFTNSNYQDSSIVRVSGLDTVLGSLDYRHRPAHQPDFDGSSWTDVTGNAHPTFAGVARPGSEVTLSVQRRGENGPLAIGTVRASRSDGSWTLTSNRRLSPGAYAVTANQTGDASPPSVLYSLDPDGSGALSSALVIETAHAAKAAQGTGKRGAQRTSTGNGVGI